MSPSLQIALGIVLPVVPSRGWGIAAVHSRYLEADVLRLSQLGRVKFVVTPSRNLFLIIYNTRVFQRRQTG
jgi:hypothetical protein